MIVWNYSYSSYLLINLGNLTSPFTMYYTGSYYVRPRSGIQFPIGYTPTQTGAVTQNLSITSNDPNNSKVTVQMIGRSGTQSSRSTHAHAHHAN